MFWFLRLTLILQRVPTYHNVAECDIRDIFLKMLMSSNCLYDKMFLQELNLHSPSKFKMHAEIDSPFSVRAFSFKKITLKSFRAFSFLEFCQIFHRGHFPLYDGHFLLGHFPFRAFSVLPVFWPQFYNFLPTQQCSSTPKQQQATNTITITKKDILCLNSKTWNPKSFLLITIDSQHTWYTFESARVMKGCVALPWHC